MGGFFFSRTMRSLSFVLFVVLLSITINETFGELSLSAERIVDLSSQFVVEEIYYEATNTGSSPLASFEIAIKADNLSQWSINKVTDKPGENQEIIEQLSAIPHAAVRIETQNGISYNIIEVTFKNPLKTNGKALVKVKTTHTHDLTPKPKQITQSDLQQMLYKGNHYIASGYTLALQVTQIRCMQVISHSENLPPVSINDEKQIVTFGSYSDVPAWSFSECYVHMYNTARFITIDSLVKDIEISHWGNVAVEESYILHHSGTPLKGTFSRLEYMMGKVGNSIPHFVQHLPEGATEVYYRDIIGNISTSHVYPHRDFVMFEIQPRFVLFGGWQDEFKIGYNLPTNPYLSVDGDRFELSLPFINNFEDAVFDDVRINVILPEGCTDVKVESSVNFYEQRESFKQTYLDTTGRVVVSLRASNLISEHRYQKLTISYKFESSTMIREPLFLIGGYCLLFFVAIIYFRTNITIHDDEEENENEVKAKQLGAEFVALLQMREGKYEPIGGKNLAKKLGQFNTEMNASSSRSQAITSKLASLDPELAHQARRVDQLSKKKTIAFRELQSASQAPANDKNKLRVAQLREDFADYSHALRNELDSFTHLLE